MALKWTFTKACEKEGERQNFHKDTKMGIHISVLSFSAVSSLDMKVGKRGAQKS